MNKTSAQKQVENLLVSEISDVISEFRDNNLTEASILCHFAAFMSAANIDTRLIVNVLEQFGSQGKQQALHIKINYGL